jgi:recombination protein RecT
MTPKNQIQKNGEQGRAMVVPSGGSQREQLEAIFTQALPKLAVVVPRHTDPNKLVRLGLAAIMKDPNLLKCTPASLLLSLLQIASLGLEPNTPLQQAYLWGTKNKKKIKQPNGATIETWVDEAQPIIGYRGYILLATQAGDLADVDADTVYEKDVLRVFRGTSPRIEHEPFQGDNAGPMVGTYTTWTLPSGAVKFHYWPLHRIKTYIKKFGFAKGAGGTSYLKSTYRDHEEAMVLKGNIRDATRFWPLSTERSDKVRKAFEIDNREASGVGPGFAEERSMIAQKAPDLLADLRALGDDPSGEVEFVVEPDDSEPGTADDIGSTDPPYGVKSDE